MQRVLSGLTTEEGMIQREEFDWGVQLTVNPLSGTKTLEIRAEISVPKGTRGSQIKIIFNGVTFADPLKLVEAQTWVEAMTALMAEARSVAASMKTAAKPKKKS
jgi:hypothetical protein